MDSELKCNILYYAREKYYQTMLNYAQEGSKIYPTDSFYKILCGFSLVLSGRFQEAIRELENLQNTRDVNVGAIVALLVAHKKCQVVDKATITLLEEKLKSERKNSQGMGLYYAALFFFFYGKLEKAREYLEKFLKHSADVIEAICLKGWIEMNNHRSSKLKTAASCFKIVMEKDKKVWDAILGLIRVKCLEGDVSEASSLLKMSLVKHPKALPLFIEHINFFLINKDWDQALEATGKTLRIENNCLEALKIKTVLSICRDGNFEEAAIHFNRLISEMEKTEAKNSALLLETSCLFSTISWRNKKILEESYKLCEKAGQLDPNNIRCVIELGYQCMRQGKLKEAQRFFKNATKLDDSSIDGLSALILCQLQMESANEMLKQQIEFLTEVEGEQGALPELQLMRAKISVDPNDANKFLRDAAEKQMKNAAMSPFGWKYLSELNVDFLHQIFDESLKWSLKSTGILAQSFLSICEDILKEITNDCPGLVDPHFELARVQFLLGEYKNAQGTLNHILDDLDASSANAHILMAQIYMQLQEYDNAARSLEVALSYNFQVRELPLYHLVSALVHKQNNKSSEVTKSLLAALNSSGFKNVRENDIIAPLVPSDKALIFIELAQSYLADNKIEEAEKVMENAQSELKGTSEEGRLLIGNAELMIAQGNLKGAIDLLRNIRPNEKYYIKAKEALADLYLKHKRDKESYAECYREVVAAFPSAKSWSSLGDAYMAISEPDSAIEAYEEALKLESSASEFVLKMGKALVKTHHFSKAINFYSESIKKTPSAQLIYELAELYFKLGQLDNAERLLVQEVTDKKLDATDIAKITLQTQLLLLLAKVRDKSGSLTDSLAALKTAKENQYRIDKRTISQSNFHKSLLSQICLDTAVLLTRLRDFNGAIKCFKETLTFKPNDPNVLVGLARLYMQSNNVEDCQTTCHHLLAADPNSEPAAIMLADIAFRKVDFETAAHHFKQLLVRRPDYWAALVRFVEVSRRLGRLDDTVVFLEKATAIYSTVSADPALSFCVGLFDWYTGNIQSSLHHFNRARNDKEWSQQALCNMIEICLNPENEVIGGEAYMKNFDEAELTPVQENALKTAQKLLMELKPQQSSDELMNHRLLNNFWLMATRRKSNIEKALLDFTKISNDDYYKDNIGAILGLATANMLLKQQQKAKNHLKKVVKTDWNYDDAEHLEKCWLLLADIYIQSGKTDLSADLIHRILEHNKSCYKAYEYAGYIAEKEQLYREAAFQYENAWKYNGRSNPAIGFKLACNYLKGKCYVDAIDVCHVVLKLDPNYPKIHKDILEKARNNLRM